MACFEPAFNPHAWKKPKDRYLADVSPKERAAIDQRNAEIDQRVADLTKAEATLRQQVRQRVLETRFNSIPEVIRGDVRQAVERKAEQRSEVQKYLAEKFAKTLAMADADINAVLTDAEQTSLKTSTEQRAALSAQK